MLRIVMYIDVTIGKVYFRSSHQHLYLKTHRTGNQSSRAAAAWLVTNCKNQSRRDMFARKLRRWHGLHTATVSHCVTRSALFRYIGVDTFGRGNCSEAQCPATGQDCLQTLGDQYHVTC